MRDATDKGLSDSVRFTEMTRVTNNQPCPRCGFESSAEIECPRCGVVYAKARPASRSRAPGPVSAGSSLFTRRGLVWIAILFAVGMGAIWVQNSGRPSEPASEVIGAGEVGNRPAYAGSPQATVDRTSSDAEPPVSSWVMEGYSGGREETLIDPWSGSSGEPVPQPLNASRSYRWLDGADGYRQAVEEARARSTGLIVYFYTDWCGYCRQLERELLNTRMVDEYLRSIPKVRINPERGRGEQTLAQAYGVRGFPSFFVHADADRRPQKIRQHARAANGWRLQRPEEFIASLRRVVG